MVETGVPFLRRRLVGAEALLDFPVLSELRDLGATDYLAAARGAVARLAEANRERADAGHDPLAFGLGIHVGDLMYGNIGVPER
jgi:adenylate cyclase